MMVVRAERERAVEGSKRLFVAAEAAKSETALFVGLRMIRAKSDSLVECAEGAIQPIPTSHRRSYVSGDQVLEPLHYLAALGRRPAALDHSNVYRQWKLPAVFG
ncbi:MAG TPA: hypothetical protein VMY42_23800, partial [Thermoguttaceae bacterium]|nr:hypothetical protein [Thermoguttaceae bacterium]